MLRPQIALLLLCLSAATARADSPKNTDPAALLQLQLPDLRITSATQEEGFIDLDGVIGGTVKIEVLLPADWNGRFVMGGGGGFVGSVMGASRNLVKEGYATAGTDTGHESSGTIAQWGLDDMMAQVNFGHLAIHRTAETTKAILRAHYGKGPEFSYFIGCSRGGGQGMMEAQRYPDDFDGIVAGAPAFHWSGIASLFVRVAQAMFPDPKKLDTPLIPQELLEPIYNELLKQCDAQDGLEDGIIANPRAVTFDVSKVPGLTDQQRAAIETVYADVKIGDQVVYPGFEYGSEKDGWRGWITGVNEGLLKNENAPTATFGFGTQGFKYLFLNDPEWDYSTYDFSNWAKDTRLGASNLNATNPDLSALKASNGKLILWHGWSDPALPAKATIDYYEQVLEHHEDAHEFTRLYLISGCLHCGAGPGPSSVDWLKVIREWVEQGQAPEMIVATSRTEEGPVKSRPLYPYPLEAVYSGQGDIWDASNFEAIAPE